jgi:hypothetical protein
MIPIAQLIEENRKVVESLHGFSFCDTARLIASLAVIPEYHANTIRIEALIQLAAVACQGNRPPNRHDLAKWIGLMRNTSAVTHEDPVEDVFIGCVNSTFGSFRIPVGVVSDPCFWIERLLKLIAENRSFPSFDVVTEQVLNLLNLSEALADRLGLHRYTSGSGSASNQMKIPRWRDLEHRFEALLFSDAQLEELHLSRDGLGRFILNEADRAKISERRLFSTQLDRKPLWRDTGGVIIIAPSCIARSAIWSLIDAVALMGSSGDTFHEIRIAETFVNDVLHSLKIEHLNFVGPPWPHSLPPMFVYFGQFDVGKPVIALSYISELTASARDFGGTDSLSDEQEKHLETYLRTCAQQLESEPHFSGGLIVCNVASARSSGFHLPRDIPNWHVHIATLPDWLTLVHSGEITAMRLWKLSEHQADLRHRRIDLFNLAGLTNLFAFWKRNGFRLVPQDVDVRRLNLFSLECDFAVQLRADVRQSHDMHCVRSHENDRWVRLLRHNIKSLFAEDTDYKLCADWDAVGGGQLLGCIEGNTLWWISVPPISGNRAVKDLVFQLWDCVLHWLARLAPEHNNAGVRRYRAAFK